ncbi:MAG: SLBB domain-containing protein, partial [Pseudomonadales bacterium]|nr:SLBB domain-containing protein [Pseudomonadales bacterium]
AVHAPGDYPLSEDDTVEDLVAAAGGLRDDAFLREIELRRVLLDEEGAARVRNIAVDLSPSAEAEPTVLRSRDHVLVRSVPDWRPRDAVEIVGEVRFPGSYVIGPGETLADVLERAGGLTRDGFADGVLFTRETLREQEARETRRFIEELRRNAASATLTLERGSNFDVRGLDELARSLESSESLGRLVVDLPRILLGDESADVVLQDGDRIEVPPLVNTVSVIGEVQRPGSFRFQQRFSVEDYLSLSAGMTRRADDDRAYVLHADGTVTPVEGRSWFRFETRDGALRPGDTIVVPIDSTYRNSLEYWEAIVQIAYQSGIALAALLAI